MAHRSGVGIFILPFPFAKVPSSAGSLTIKVASPKSYSTLVVSYEIRSRNFPVCQLHSPNSLIPPRFPFFLLGVAHRAGRFCVSVYIISHYHLPPFPRSFSRGIVACSTWVARCNFRSTLRQDLSPVRASKASISKDWAAMLHLYFYRSQSL